MFCINARQNLGLEMAMKRQPGRLKTPMRHQIKARFAKLLKLFSAMLYSNVNLYSKALKSVIKSFLQ